MRSILTKWPDDIAERLTTTVPLGDRSQFIRDAVVEKLDRLTTPTSPERVPRRDSRGTVKKGAAVGRGTPPTRPPPRAPKPPPRDEVQTFFKPEKGASR